MRAAQPISILEHDDQVVPLTPKQRSSHFHIVGPPGSGKSRLLAHWITQDIQAGHGVCVIDPLGGLYDHLVRWCAARGMHRRRKIHFFDPNSDDHVIGFNPLARRVGEDVSKRVDTMAQACARVWSNDLSATPLLKRMLRMVFTVLVERDLTLAEAVDLIVPPTTEVEHDIRSFLTRSNNTYIDRLWSQLLQEEAQKAKRGGEAEDLKSTNNRMSEFLMSERMARIFGYGLGSLDLEQCMKDGHCVFVNLQTTNISDDNARLLGTLITNELLQVARARDNSEAARAPFYCYIDEAYRFLSEDVEQALDETRQKGLHYILAHQRLSQLKKYGPHVYGGVMGIRNKVVFGDLPVDETQALAEDLCQALYDENQEVELLRRPTLVGHEVRRNLQRREGVGEGAGVSRASGEARSRSKGAQAQLSLPMNPFGHLAGDLMTGGGSLEGTAEAHSRGEAKQINRSRTVTDGWAESAWPILEERAGALRSRDEQMHIYAKRLKALGSRQVMLKLRQQSPVTASVPYVGDPVTRSRRLPNFLAAAAERSRFTVSAETVSSSIGNRRKALTKEAQVRLVDTDEADPQSPLDFFS